MENGEWSYGCSSFFLSSAFALSRHSWLPRCEQIALSSRISSTDALPPHTLGSSALRCASSPARPCGGTPAGGVSDLLDAVLLGEVLAPGCSPGTQTGC